MTLILISSITIVKKTKILRRTLALLFVLLFIQLSWAYPVLADIAPPKPPTGSNLDPGSENTNVRMMAETVTIEVPSFSNYETGQATVTAVFRMRNLSTVEERMSVRFPLCSADTGYPMVSVTGELELLSLQGYIYHFPPIENFSVWVNGNSSPVTKTEEKLEVMDNGNFSEINIPCWANFPVVFPPGQDVNIKVQYIQVGGYGEFDHGTTNFVTLEYILFTGAGWKDTIGSADITVRFPVNADDLSLSVKPKEGTISGKEVRWHFENFEPDYENIEAPHSINLTFLQPKYWYKIQEERANIAANSNDGEAWGFLAKALKNAYTFEHGFLSEKLYWESFDAYQKAVSLLPNDADWHYGFAELVCYNAINFSYGGGYLRNPTDYQEPYRLCIEQLSQTLKINANHVRANELTQYLAMQGWIDLSGPIPVYQTLTPTAPATSTPTQTPQPTTILTLANNINPIPSSTNNKASTATNTPQSIVHAATSVPTSSPDTGTRSCAAILLPLILTVIFSVIRNRS